MPALAIVKPSTRSPLVRTLIIFGAWRATPTGRSRARSTEEFAHHSGVRDVWTLLQLVSIVVLFVFPGVAAARWYVETPQRERQQQADHRRRQMRFPGDSRFD